MLFGSGFVIAAMSGESRMKILRVFDETEVLKVEVKSHFEIRAKVVSNDRNEECLKFLRGATDT